MVNERPEINLADELAIERTALANERTLLSYIRTSLGVLAAAITLLKFFNSNGMHMLGYGLVPVGVGVLMVGMMRYNEVRQRLFFVTRKRD